MKKRSCLKGNEATIYIEAIRGKTSPYAAMLHSVWHVGGHL